MSALAAYYQAQANEYNARVPLLGAQADQTREQTFQIAPDSAARRAVEYANANLTGVQASQLPLDSAAKRDNLAANSELMRDQAYSLTSKTPYDNALDAARTRNLDVTTSDQSSLAPFQQRLLQLQGNQAAAGLRPFGFEKGGIVGRKKDAASPGKTDTVPAMLAPGEAIINKHAVDHYGADVIDHMNKMGMMRKKAHAELTKLVKDHLEGGKAGAKKAKRKAA